MNYTPLYKAESVGTYGVFGIKIEVAGDQLPDLDQLKIRIAVSQAAKLVEAEVMAATIAVSPKAQQARSSERAEILGLFNEVIFAKEIPNGYCSEWCCRHLPWFHVATRVGYFKIGWRKRVIEIDWEETIGTTDADTLFPEENVTKSKRMIHAWSIEDARRYVGAIIASGIATGEASR